MGDGQPTRRGGLPPSPGDPGRRIPEARLGVADEGTAPESRGVPAGNTSGPAQGGGDSRVMGEEKPREVVAQGESVRGRGAVHARSIGIDDQGGGAGDEGPKDGKDGQ